MLRTSTDLSGDLGALDIDIPQLFTQEAEFPFLVAQGNLGFLQHGFNGLAHWLLSRVSIDSRMHQTGYILDGDGQVPQNLQHRNGLGHLLIQVRVVVKLTGCLRSPMDRWKGSLNIFF